MAELRRLRSTLEVIIDELGTQATLRQALTLTITAIANKAAHPIGVAVLDKELGNLSPGTSSKIVKQMVHIETPRKGSLANTLEARRDPNDFRKWELLVTEKGSSALASVLDTMNGRAQL
jgi:DNA-binding MarR family transcriptional regulator